ncbi:hypothetical protein [Vibrio viridaestus]|nr:hypothetical protein [Vibrio viridaestus]
MTPAMGTEHETVREASILKKGNVTLPIVLVSDKRYNGLLSK